jgi:CBS domain-containing protein
VGDVMTPREELHTVTGETSVNELIDRMFSERHTGYPVLDDTRLVGMVTLEDAGGVRDVERDAYRVADVMETDLVSVTPDTDAMTAFEMMQQQSVGRLPVLDEHDELVGLISRTDLMTALNVIQTGGTPSLLRSRSLIEEDRSP